jgi:hypothetical protein
MKKRNTAVQIPAFDAYCIKYPTVLLRLKYEIPGEKPNYISNTVQTQIP